VGMPPLQQEKAQEIFAFLQKQKGSFEDFTIQAPLDNLGASKSETDIVVNGAHTSGDNTIAMDGFSQTTGALKAGDYIKFANHSKVYMVSEDANASGGAATVTISPNLVYSTDASGFYSISFDVREVIT
jgi:polyisoprenoid-binding protein YceI